MIAAAAVSSSNAYKPNANDQQFIDDLIFTGGKNGVKDNKKVIVSRAFIKRLQQGAAMKNGISSPGPDISNSSENMLIN